MWQLNNLGYAVYVTVQYLQYLYSIHNSPLRNVAANETAKFIYDTQKVIYIVKVCLMFKGCVYTV